MNTDTLQTSDVLQDPPQQTRARILIVDDEPANIHLLAEILRDDYHVNIATSGATALKIVQEHDQPDLILLDVSMPEMDGYEVCRRLNQNESSRHIPVLFVTALQDEEFELKGLELGAMDYLTKPVRPAVVRQRVKNGIALKRQHDELQRTVARLEQLTRELLYEKETIKVLEGIIPICCVCKKIRNDEGYWKQLETYISEHSEASFTHGYCPECSKELMDQYNLSKNDLKPGV